MYIEREREGERDVFCMFLIFHHVDLFGLPCFSGVLLYRRPSLPDSTVICVTNYKLTVQKLIRRCKTMNKENLCPNIVCIVRTCS